MRTFQNIAVIMLILIASFFTSCTLLWDIKNAQSVSIQINLDSLEKYNNAYTHEYMLPHYSGGVHRSIVPPTYEDGSVSVEDSEKVIVSIHTTSKNRLIASKSISLEEAKGSDVVFSNIPLNTLLYAKIEVLSASNEALFTASTLETVLKPGENILEARPSSIRLQSSQAVIYPSTDNSGSITINDKTNQEVLQELYSIMSVEGNLVFGANVLVESTLSIENDETWNFPGLTVLWATNDDSSMILMSGEDTSLTLSNVTLSGSIGVEKNTRMISVENNATLTIKDGTTIQNAINASAFPGGAIYLNGATLIMSGGTIKDCIAENGGAVYVSSFSDFTMNRGSLINNTARQSGGAINIQGTMVLKGGTIQYNTTTVSSDASGGGGIAVVGGDLQLEGDPIVKNNTKNGLNSNIFLTNAGTRVVIQNTLTGLRNSIGISSSFDEEVATGSLSPEYILKETDAQKFFSDEGHTVSLDSLLNTISLNE